MFRMYAVKHMGEFSVKLYGAFGVLDVASGAYGELRRYAQESFGVLDVASEAYGENSVSRSINQSTIRILTACSSILTSS